MNHTWEVHHTSLVHFFIGRIADWIQKQKLIIRVIWLMPGKPPGQPNHLLIVSNQENHKT
jgi:hypothetical protein